MKSDRVSCLVARVATQEIASKSPAIFAKLSPGPATVGTWAAKVSRVNRTRPTYKSPSTRSTNPRLSAAAIAKRGSMPASRPTAAVTTPKLADSPHLPRRVSAGTVGFSQPDAPRGEVDGRLAILAQWRAPRPGRLTVGPPR